jgi:hypothetical protein
MDIPMRVVKARAARIKALLDGFLRSSKGSKEADALFQETQQELYKLIAHRDTEEMTKKFFKMFLGEEVDRYRKRIESLSFPPPCNKSDAREFLGVIWQDRNDFPSPRTLFWWVNLKQYYTVALPRRRRAQTWDDYRREILETADQFLLMTPILQNALVKITQTHGVRINFKFASTLRRFLEHRDSLVIYYSDRIVAEEIREAVEEIAGQTHVKLSERSFQVSEGFDIADVIVDQLTSHTNVVAQIVAAWTLKEYFDNVQQSSRWSTGAPDLEWVSRFLVKSIERCNSMDTEQLQGARLTAMV